MSKSILSAEIKQLDDNGQTIARRDFTIEDTDPNAGGWQERILIDTNEATIGLPYATIRQIGIRNTHASAKITVKWTPNGGAEATITTLGPNAGIILFDPNAIVSGRGITSLKLTSDVADATYEMYLGG